ncbi:glucose-1-phosphate thymidylyltransferase [Kitasatospora sp. NPDC056446]|uniref:glucose-1-phosphate thymidylyltransferase n=1 Tax=Kitasatospora sp. NPDC056446 TaxID=3345819 RepID=UPI0036AECB8F
MKALVLSGGMGTRLRPLTHSMPKQLVPIAGKPVLVHCLDRIRDAGITDIGIVVGERAKEIEAALGDGSQLGVRLTYIQQEAPFGLAHCVLIAREFLAEDDFVMYLGDNVLDADLGALMEPFLTHRPAAQLVVTKVPNPSESGVAEVDAGGVVLRVEEKPARPRSDLAMVGVYFFTPAVHRAVREIPLSWRNEWEITDAIQWLLDDGQEVRASVHDGFWKDTGRVEGILDSNRVLLDELAGELAEEPSELEAGVLDGESTVTGPVRIGPGVRLIRSHVVGPAVIGAGTVIEDSRVGPYTALGERCVLRRAGIEDSITLDGVEVDGVTGIRESLIGKAAQITQRPSEPGVNRLVVGDHTRMEVGA